MTDLLGGIKQAASQFASRVEQFDQKAIVRAYDSPVFLKTDVTGDVSRLLDAERARGAGLTSDSRVNLEQTLLTLKDGPVPGEVMSLLDQSRADFTNGQLLAPPRLLTMKANPTHPLAVQWLLETQPKSDPGKTHVLIVQAGITGGSVSEVANEVRPTPGYQPPATGVPKDQAQVLAAVGRAGAQRGRDAGEFGPVGTTAATAVTPGKAGGTYLMCPVLGSLIAEGSLHVDAKGDISLKELYEAMVNRLGISPERAAVTVSTGFIGNHLKDAPHVLEGHFNLKDLQGSILDHQAQGDTGILRGGQFHEERFQALVAHSKDGKTLTVQDFSEAISQQLHRDKPGKNLPKGTSEDIFEMSALINTFGTTDSQGVRRIDIQTLRNLYQLRLLPPAPALMQGRPATGVAQHAATMGKMGKDLAVDAFQKALAKAEGTKTKGVCPYLNQLGAAKPN